MDVYRILSDSKSHSSVTGKKAFLSNKVGGTFSTLSGEVTGVIVDLSPHKRIVQAWRRKDFPEGIFSMAAMTLKATSDGGTELVLTHRGVPKDLIPGVESSWRENYWNKIKNKL